MKKFYWLFVALISVFLVWGLFFYPVRIEKTVQVPYSMFKTGEQLINAKNLVNWLIPFTIKDTAGISKTNQKEIVVSGNYSAEINNISMFSTVITAKYNNSKKAFSFISLPDSSGSATTTIKLQYHSTLFRKWFSKSRLEKNAEESLENLKDYMTDTRRFYGYEIKIVPVEDTTFLFSRVIVPITERKEATKKIFEKLIAYAEKNNAGYNGTRIYYSQKSGSDIAIFASIGVTNIVEIPANSDIEFKRMPYQKNLLMTTYQGPFDQSNKAFVALENFKLDHSMTSMAIPFQKFMSDGYDFDDDQVVQLNIYYPIF